MEKFKTMYRISFQEVVEDDSGKELSRDYGRIYTTLTVPEAHEYLQKRLNIGRVVITEFEKLELLFAPPVT